MQFWLLIAAVVIRLSTATLPLFSWVVEWLASYATFTFQVLRNICDYVYEMSNFLLKAFQRAQQFICTTIIKWNNLYPPQASHFQKFSVLTSNGTLCKVWFSDSSPIQRENVESFRYPQCLGITEMMWMKPLKITWWCWKDKKKNLKHIMLLTQLLAW